MDAVIIRQSIFSFYKDSVQELWSEVVRKPWLWINCPSYSCEKLTSCLACGIMLPGFPKLLLSHISSSDSPMLIHYLKMSLQKLFPARLRDFLWLVLIKVFKTKFFSNSLIRVMWMTAKFSPHRRYIIW